MCTCIFLKGTSSYFGRNMDIHYSFNEKIIFVNKDYQIDLKKEKELILKYSILGIGAMVNNYPLFADAMNEKGLAIAGLNFLGNAFYFECEENKINIAPYELPLFLLGTCCNLNEVKEILKKINIVNIPFSKELMLSELHFMVSSKEGSIVIEQTKEGLKVYENEFNVLTNNPPFPCHKNNMVNYSNLSLDISYNKVSYGEGLIGLPGDYSSMSRFIKAYFLTKYISLKEDNILQFFYCLDSVLMPKGLVRVGKQYEYTRYQVCYDLEEKYLYYKTYENRNIKQIDMFMYINEEIKELNLF